MRLLPRSLFSRLLALGVVSTLVALIVAGFAIGQVLERFVMRGLDDRLDAQLLVLARATAPDGRLDRVRVVDLPGFDVPGSGWRWQVEGGGQRWTSDEGPALATDPVEMRGRPPREHPFDAPRPEANEPRPGETHDAEGRRLHSRTLVLDRPAGPVTLVAAGPRRIVLAPLREAMVPLVACLAMLGALLTAATLLQLRLGLQPLRALRQSVADVTAGAQRHVPEAQPAELAPLAGELNRLIDRNAAQLAQARGHVANLAHGLKTPLAGLALLLRDRAGDEDGALTAAIGDIDRRIAHHLRRARAAAPGTAGERITLATAATDLVRVLRGVHADRAVAIDLCLPSDLAVAVDPQDLDEMLGNLLDNAWRHARAQVRLSGTTAAPFVRIVIEDDGPGLSAAERDEAMIAGRRLDEATPGHGFGLPITRELAELNGGEIGLGASPLGGLRVTLLLPSGRDA